MCAALYLPFEIRRIVDMALKRNRLPLTKQLGDSLVSQVQAALTAAGQPAAIPHKGEQPYSRLLTDPVYVQWGDGWQIERELLDQPAVRVYHSNPHPQALLLWVPRYRQVLLAAGFGCSPLLTDRPPEQPANPNEWRYKRSAEVIYDPSDPTALRNGLFFYVTAAMCRARLRVPQHLDFYA